MAQGMRVIAASQPIGDHVVETYGIEPARIRIIPPGIDVFSFDPRRVSAERLMTLSGTWRLPDGQPVVLIPGPVDYARGLGVVLDAIGRLTRRDLVCLLGEPGTRLPEDAQVLNRLVERHALEGVVRSVPELKDMPAALMLADVVITVATAPEACGRVLAEAQTMGRPVVAADRFGADEFMLADETGWLVPPDDPVRLADVLRHVLGLSAEERGALADRAMPHARDRFSRERLGEAIIELYEDVLAEARVPAGT
jgi:glycosyltransferase involved in cell wall biosynthesis